MAQEPQFLTVEFYREAGPYYSEALNEMSTEERLKSAAKSFSAALEKEGFRGDVDISVTGQVTVKNPDETVDTLARSLPYTTFRYKS